MSEDTWTERMAGPGAGAAFEEELPADASSALEDLLFAAGAPAVPVRRPTSPDGAYHDRTVGNRAVHYALQLYDYDVNDWVPRKRKHREALSLLARFIARNGPRFPEAIGVTLTGAASRTGTAPYNMELSRRRAHEASRALAQQVRALSPGLLARTRFNALGQGFTRARCRMDPSTGRNQCELPEYRSVLIQIHPVSNPPPPVPVEPRTWDRYRIRCCSCSTAPLLEGKLGDLLQGRLALPAWAQKALAKAAKKILEKALLKAWSLLVRRLEQYLPKVLLTLGEGEIGAILALLPIAVTQEKAVFQILERDVARPAGATLCYQGYGLRVLDSRDMPSIASFVGPLALVPKSVWERLGNEINRILGLPPTPPQYVESTVPGPFVPFDLDVPRPITAFQTEANVQRNLFTGAALQLSFSFVPDARGVPVIRCAQGCSPTSVTVPVGGDPRATQFYAVSIGKLAGSGCRCG